MKIRNVIHKGLRRFIEDDDSSGLPAGSLAKIRDIVSFLQGLQQEKKRLRPWLRLKISA
jgi:proteic killer suppression protein